MFLNMTVSVVLALSALGSSGSSATLPVEEAFASDSMTQSGQTLVRFSVYSNEYYLYRERFDVVDASGDAIQYAYASPGEAHYDEFFGETYIYRDEAMLMVFTDEPFTVTYQGCKAKMLCYPPAMAKFN